MFAHLDDDRSLFQSYDESCGQILCYGINVIQTDFPHFLKEYRQTVEGSEKHDLKRFEPMEPLYIFEGPVNPPLLEPQIGIA